MTEPQIETPYSILSYAKKNNLEGVIYIPKDGSSFDTITKYFSFGQIYVFDQNLNLLNCNLESMGGECFQDITDQICNGLNIKKRKLDERIDGSTVLNLIKNNTVSVTQNEPSPSKFTIVYPWVMYSRSCIDSNSLKFIECVKNRSDVSVILLNFDLQDFNG